jgi:hypothetical protein
LRLLVGTRVNDAIGAVGYSRNNLSGDRGSSVGSTPPHRATGGARRRLHCVDFMTLKHMAQTF